MPLLVVCDGAPGLLGAVEAKLSAALRQRCLINRARNVAAKVAAERWRRIRHTYLIERTFAQTQRRVNCIGRLPGKASCPANGRWWREMGTVGCQGAVVHGERSPGCRATSPTGRQGSNQLRHRCARPLVTVLA